MDKDKLVTAAEGKSPAQTRSMLAPPVNDVLLAEIVRRIAAHLPDCCIVLFGSYAYGEAREESDVDLLVVSNTTKGTFTVAGELYRLLRPRRITFDIVVMTPEMYRRRRSGFDPFLKEVAANGRVLHGQLP